MTAPRKSAPEDPPRSPIYFGPVSNGEFVPRLPRWRDAVAGEWVHRLAEACARRRGIGRREFLKGAGGMAAALWVLNRLTGCNAFRVSEPMMCDEDAARTILSGDEFIFDVQTHHINPDPAAPWQMKNIAFKAFFLVLPQAGCGEPERLRCLSQEAYLREIFVNSDTTVAVLSGVPAQQDKNPLTNDEIASTRDLVDRLAGSPRLLTHGMVLPNLGESELDGMERLWESLRIAAWKVYTPWGPTGTGWWHDDPVIGIPFLERVRRSGAKVVCTHKGFPLPTFNPEFADPKDIGPAAKLFPDIRFIVYHSGYDPTHVEGPYDPEGIPETVNEGINRLIRSVLVDGPGPNANVFAELGSTWRALMTEPEQAAHMLGKLVKFLGEDRVVWGTDSIWYGSPQAQIQAFRAFQIPEEMQSAFGYPDLTTTVKAKILGLNAASAYGIDPHEIRCSIQADELSGKMAEAAERPFHLPAVYGPRSRREFLSVLRRGRGRPA